MLTQAPSQAQSETSADIQLALSNPLYCKTVQEIRDEKQVGGEDDNFAFPDLLYALIDEEFHFVVNVHPQFNIEK
ncbi:hypothetical protein RIF29_33012 [Crotalaria pallida]|uniref:Uncharacterized protein n=1 Tax=Crotalaria pallida TaxID=3830 RepID=A0AAN9HQG0_CROPI